MKSLIAAAVLSLVANLCVAQASPTGLWKTIDDETKVEKSLVRVSDTAGVFSAVIEKLLDPAKADAKCDKCSDERKDKPVMGMTILRNVKQSSNDAELWDGGDILDPNNGKVYKVRLKPVEGGKKMEVRGYIGMPMLGRTQTWIRVE
ncbi:DUF2147 domain-containing protein [Roseateles oligotrophus]|uniref:DUF2147 domain-containing protein n=1 Tax=Roseateles oligotrophus TaxID=1769250 RepID=A0ABT2YEM0_9BURK|nr:DUF2147 domain-containing protein [Roseateles oligotrophus]MCV2368472.1 DUF2147 domain-containing protein [Roseateles oligotrophus]